MPRRALRPSFVITFALGAAALASGCNGGVVSNNPPMPSPDGGGDSSIGDGSNDDGGCPVDQPTNGAPCNLPSSAMCIYPGTMMCTTMAAECAQGSWNVFGWGSCNPPGPVSEAGPDVYEGGPDVSDGEGPDGGHD